MNLRILKTLSKRAAPLLALLGDTRKQFRAEPFDSYTKLLIRDRKHFERGRSVHADCIREGEIKRPAKDGNGWIWMAPPSHPRKGTIMVGATSGYYEPEWDEETAWDSFCTIIWAHFTDWENDAVPLRRLRTPTEFFRAAKEVLSVSSKRRGGEA